MSSSNTSEQDNTCRTVAAPEPLLSRQSSHSSLAYDRVKLLGVGGSGLVYLVERKTDGRQFALKVQRKDKLRVKQGRIRRALIEREALVSCSHPFICSLYAAFQDEKHVFMVLEHAALGDLTHVVSDHLKRCLTEAELRFYASEIIAALEWVHLNGVRPQARERLCARLRAHQTRRLRDSRARH
eukprot:9462-Heterococcus_DN1.PRE.2